MQGSETSGEPLPPLFLPCLAVIQCPMPLTKRKLGQVVQRLHERNGAEYAKHAVEYVIRPRYACSLVQHMSRNMT